MTFKEKLQMEHPEKLDKHCGGGCEGCPCFYGYEETKWCGNTWGANCEDCWNREIPGTDKETEESLNIIEAHNKAYEQGMSDAWELAKRLYEFTCDELEEIFGVKYGFHDLISKYNSQEALAKLKAYEEQSKIKVGNVVERTDDGTKGVALAFDSADPCVWVLTENQCVEEWDMCDIKKTDKHINLDSILEQIGE